MAEWSNATDLSSVLFGGAGSNPAGVNKMIHTAITSKNFDFYSKQYRFNSDVSEMTAGAG